MARYSIGNTHAGTQQILTTTYKTQVSLTAASGATTLRRAFVYDVTFSADTAPADNVISYVVNRQTDVGTGTAAVSSPLDSQDAAALITETVCHTVEPTITAATQMIEVAVNQRASYRWVASPGGELVIPATDTDGIGFRAKSPAYVLTVLTNVHFFE